MDAVKRTGPMVHGERLPRYFRLSDGLYITSYIKKLSVRSTLIL